MTYNGNYTAGFIYGTLNNNSIKASTATANSFLVCELQANYLNEVWTHTFEVPFFNGEASLFIENYIHSLMTQKFTTPPISNNDFTFVNTDISFVTLVLKEKKDGVILNTQTIDFYMMLGKIDPINFTPVYENTEKYLLETIIANYTTVNGTLSFSYLSGNNPTKLLVNGTPYTLPVSLTNKLLHSLIVPVKLIANDFTDVIDLKLEFADATVIGLGSFYVTPIGTDHSSFAYQNVVGGISLIEFTGDLKIKEDIKPTDFNYLENNKETIATNKIDTKNTYTVDTGYITDVSKYKQIRAFLNSFNIFFRDTTLKRVVLSGAQKLQPYETDATDQKETLTFKQATNDDIYNGFI